jgi:hypothetical protein
MHRTPPLSVQQIQANNAIAVNVRVHGNRALRRRSELHLGRFDRVGVGESEPQAVEVCGRVDGVVEDGDVHLPFFEVGRGDEGDAGWEGALDLGRRLAVCRVGLVSVGGGGFTFTSSFCRRLLLIAAILVVVYEIESRVVVKLFRWSGPVDEDVAESERRV